MRKPRIIKLLGICSLAAAGPLQLLANTVVYNSIPDPLPYNLPSLGYQATSTAEFGELIQFAGTGVVLSYATVMMSDWAKASEYGSTDPYWAHDITLNLYNVGPGNTPGNLIASVTQEVYIPWRPEADPSCPNGGTAWRAADGNCYNGLGFTVKFWFFNLPVPNQIIYGLAFNTNTWGYQPIGQSGPFESLNFALSGTAPLIGSNPLPDTAYWNTKQASFYADHGAAGTGTFRQDTGWNQYAGAISFNAGAAPEPGTLGLMLAGCAFVLLGSLRRRR